jgi:cysteine synthase A
MFDSQSDIQSDIQWVKEAVRRIEADFNRSTDTHLIRLSLPFSNQILLYLKDESTHPTGSLKHRLARSLFLYGLCNGWIHKGTPIIETSSGSTAISEAYFAQLLELPFIAVIPQSTSKEKIRQIEFYGGQTHLVEDPRQIYAEAHQLAADHHGHYIDQFTYAERATDWRGNNNIAESIFAQMSLEPHPEPRWIVVGAGTGGTSATIGRYIRLKCKDSQLCVVDPTQSVFYDFYHSGNGALIAQTSSKVEGIGRPRVEPSFIPQVIDRMIRVPDAASFATIHFLEKIMGRRVGGSTGTNVYGAFQLIAEMVANQEAGSVATMICDAGARYGETYYDADWLQANGYDLAPYLSQLEGFYQTGQWDEIEGEVG